MTQELCLNKGFIKGKICMCKLKVTTVCVYLPVFQLVKGIRYTITVELSNTQCKKSTMLRTCDFYPESQKLKVGLCMCVCERVSELVREMNCGRK